MKKYFPFIYYGILLFIMAFRVSTIEPPMVYRLLFLIAIFVPAILLYNFMIPSCIIAFYTVGVNGFSYGLMPYNIVFYIIILLLAIVLCSKNINYSGFLNKENIILFIFFIVSILIDLLVSGGGPEKTYMLFLLILFSFFLQPYDNKGIISLMNGFCMVSLAFSLVYLINYKAFLVVYASTEGLERSGWLDPNYFSCMIGMGIVTAILQLFRKSSKPLLLKIFLIIVVVISFIVQVLVASRGGLLTTLGSITIILLFSKIKKIYKLLFIVFASVFIILLYTNNAFELLVYRLNDDASAGGSGRLEIWENKLTYFIESSNVIQLLFGGGYNSGYISYGNRYVAFHNEFIATLCCYGLFGLISFICLLYFPLKNVKKSNRYMVLVLIIFLILECLTLEPFSLGYPIIYGYYFLILAISKYRKTL